MRCYYQVLGVPLEADEDEIKKAYRKSALRLHPDKNIGRETQAAEEFKELQGAYATLSDPQERAFYDRNRKSIIKGGGEAGGVSKTGEAGGASSTIPDPFKYFSTSCFPGGYTDATNGFYSTYRRFFFDLYSKDCEYAKNENVPQFGHATSDLDEVADFYGYWTCYCTSISFAWCDKINIREARNRWMEEQIMRENKKFRDKERKKFNESIRQLALYCRKRDPRWKKRLELLEQKKVEEEKKNDKERKKLYESIRQLALNCRKSDPRWKKRLELFEQKKVEAQKKNEEQKAKNAEMRRELLERDMKDENIKKMREEYLQKLEEFERRHYSSRYSNDERSQGSGDNSKSTSANNTDCEEEEIDPLACEICIKVFNSIFGLESHLKSKNHRTRVQMFFKEHNLEDDPMEEIAAPKKEKLSKKQRKNKKAGFHVEESEKKECDIKSEELSDENLLSNMVEDIKLEENKEEGATSVNTTKIKEKRKLKGNKAEEAIDENATESICQTCGSKFPSRIELFVHMEVTVNDTLKEYTGNRRKKKKVNML